MEGYVCEAAMVALKRWDPEGGASPRTFLYRRLNFSLIDYWREVYKPHISESPLETVISNSDEEDYYIDDLLAQEDQNLIQVEDRETVWRLLRLLNQQQQTVLISQYLLDEPIHVTAARIGLGEWSVYKIRKEALAQLRAA